MHAEHAFLQQSALQSMLSIWCGFAADVLRKLHNQAKQLGITQNAC